MKTELDNLRGRVIGAAMAVHRSLGPGFLESVYQKALALELRSLGISYEEQVPISVQYRGESVGDFVADFRVENCLLVEIKSVSTLLPAHEVQLVNYLTATQTDEGLLINFGAPSLEFQRKLRIRNPVHPVNPVPPPAFTLLELLVAMAVLSILVVMMMGLVSSATSLWRVSENRAEAYREARAAFSIITRDLANTIANTNTNLFKINDAAFLHLDPDKTVTDPTSASAIFFHSALPQSAQDTGLSKSDVCQVGYFLAFAKTAMSTNLPGSQASMNLYRYFLSSDPTFEALTNSPTAAPFPYNIIPTDGSVELLARNIREFRLTPYVLTNGSLTTNFPQSGRALPDLVEVTITAVNQEAAKRLPAKEDWVTDDPARPIIEGQQTFTTRIHLNQPAN